MQIKTITIGIISALLTTCTGSQNIELESFSFSDSCKYANLSLEGELPKADNQVTQVIRDTLLYIIEKQLCFTDYEGNDAVKWYEGDRTDLSSIIDYYGKSLFNALSSQSRNDIEERNRYIMADETMSDEEKQRITSDFPGWDYSLSLKLDTVTSRYAIFQNNSYIYQGGAHGGVSGAGAVTFDMKTGKRIASFIDKTHTHQLQSLLRRGLRTYFSAQGEEVADEDLNDCLLLNGEEIPLPECYVPCPGKDGLVFTYAQYEIACYAAGMPSFTIPYCDLLPYLTDEAKELLSDEINK